MDVAFAAGSGFQVVFEVAVLRRGAAELFDGGFGERGAAQIRVQDYAGGVDDRLEGAGKDLLDGGGDSVFQRRRVEGEEDRLRLACDLCAQVGERGAGNFEQQCAIDSFRQGSQAGLSQEFVNRGDLAKQLRLVGRKGAPAVGFHGRHFNTESERRGSVGSEGRAIGKRLNTEDAEVGAQRSRRDLGTE